MRVSDILLSIIMTGLTLDLYAADRTIVCNPPQGTRVDYFSMNKINLQNENFIMARDQVIGMQPKITIQDDKNVSFSIDDVSAGQKGSAMQVLLMNPEQITFAGLINEAPILATYYPKLSILIYSQQSIWPGPDYQGARAVIFYAKCKE